MSDAAETKEKLNTRSLIFIFVCCMYITCLMLAFITSIKVHTFDVFGFSYAIPAGTIAFALTFFCTDLVSEVWGKKPAIFLIFSSLVLRLFCLVYFSFTIYAESEFQSISVPSFWTLENQKSIETILGGSNDIIWWGIVTFLAGALIDVQIYHFFKDKAVDNNHINYYDKLWFRNNCSTIIGQAINSILFVAIIFGSKMSIEPLLVMMFTLILVKVIVSIIDTIPLYILRNIAEGNKLLDFSR